MNIIQLIVDNVKKVTLSLCLGVALLASYDAKAASATVVVQANSMTNVLNGTFIGSAFVTSVTISAPTNTSTVYFYDTITNSTVWTNSAYTNYSIVATNNVITYTNYYGATNNITNFSLVHITNNVGASTNNWPLRLITTATSTSPTVTYAPNVYFLDGIWVTNVTTNSATINITYRQ